MCTNVKHCPKKVIELYIDRWTIEVTFEQTREYLGVETKRQWSDAAIARTTPILIALYSLVCLMACNLHKESPLERQSTARYEKKHPPLLTASWRFGALSGGLVHISRRPKKVLPEIFLFIWEPAWRL
jgi:hypothetical protein